MDFLDSFNLRHPMINVELHSTVAGDKKDTAESWPAAATAATRCISRRANTNRRSAINGHATSHRAYRTSTIRRK